MLIKDIEKMEAYTPTEYVNDSEPDLDADNLNKTERQLRDTVAKANEIIDTLKSLISNVSVNSEDTVPSSAVAYKMEQDIEQLNSNISVVKNSVTDVQNKITNHDISSDTILNWFIAHKNDASDTFVVSSYHPSDEPENAEAYVKFLRGSNGNRTIVYWIPYGVSSTDKYIFKRTIFNNAWNGPWVKYNYQ